MKIKTVAIIGMGAIGCTVAPGLYNVLGNNFFVIAGGNRKSKLEKGIIINNKLYQFPIISPEEAEIITDLVIVAVKDGHLSQAIQDMKNFVGPNTMIMSLMNGISSEEVLGKVFGMEKIIYCVTSINAQFVRDSVNFLLTSGEILFGERMNRTLSERVQAIAFLLNQAGLPYSVPENMTHAIWKKYLNNVSINTIAGVLKAHNRYFQELDAIYYARKCVIDEVKRVSDAVGAGLTAKDCEDALHFSKNYDPLGTCSMVQDVRARRRTEKEMLLGTLIKLAEKTNVDVPVSKFLYHMLSVVEEANDKGWESLIR